CVCHQCVEHCAFFVGETRRCRSAAECCRYLGRQRSRQIDVDAEQSCRSLPRHRAGDWRAPVSALRDITGVTEALHQFRPSARDVIRVPAGAGRPTGEAVARQRRDDDVESILGATSVRRWIRKRIDDLELLNHRSGPAVRDDDRERIRMTRTDVDEVDVNVVDRCHELREDVELGLALSPVLVRSPITHELLEFCELYSLRLVGNRFLVRPTGPGDASAQINELIFRNIAAERTDRVTFRSRGQICGEQAYRTRSGDSCDNGFNKAAAIMVDFFGRSNRSHVESPAIISMLRCRSASFAIAFLSPRRPRWRPLERLPKYRPRPFRLVTRDFGQYGPQRPAPRSYAGSGKCRSSPARRDHF